jgi:hypothetical protein
MSIPPAIQPGHILQFTPHLQIVCDDVHLQHAPGRVDMRARNRAGQAGVAATGNSLTR